MFMRENNWDLRKLGDVFFKHFTRTTEKRVLEYSKSFLEVKKAILKYIFLLKVKENKFHVKISSIKELRSILS